MSDFQTETTPTARKQHTCGECYGAIEPGQKYQLVTGCWEGSMDSCKTCLPCVEARKWAIAQPGKEVRHDHHEDHQGPAPLRPEGISMTVQHETDSTLAHIKKIFRYEDGLLYRVCNSGPAKAGSVAGSPHHTGYWYVKVFGNNHSVHRVIWALCTGAWPTACIDHRNMNKADNRIENLREATASENMMNKPATRVNTTGFKGVDFSRRHKQFRARIKKNGVSRQIGYFDTAEEASLAYQNAAATSFGKFARQ